MNAPNKTQITLRLTKETDRKLTERSKRMGVSKNAFILIAIDNYLSEKGDLLEETKQAG